MLKITTGIIVIICTLAGTWSVLDKHLVTAILYYAVGVFMYNRLEKQVFKD